jgi:hypothetical protein
VQILATMNATDWTYTSRPYSVGPIRRANNTATNISNTRLTAFRKTAENKLFISEMFSGRQYLEYCSTAFIGYISGDALG